MLFKDYLEKLIGMVSRGRRYTYIYIYTHYTYTFTSYTEYVIMGQVDY